MIDIIKPENINIEILINEYLEVARIKASTYYGDLGQSYRFHDIQDLVQELLIAAFKAIKTYQSGRECSLNTWINLKMDYHIADFQRKEINKKIHIEYVGDLYDLYKYVESYYKTNLKLSKDLVFDYENLSDKQKRILEMIFQGHTQDEIAKSMGYSDNSAVARQCNKIRKIILEEKGVFPQDFRLEN